MSELKKLVYWDSNPNPGRTESFTVKGETFCAREGWEFEYVPKGIVGYLDAVIEAWEEGEGPDVIDVWPVWLPRLIQTGKMQRLDSSLNSWAKGGDYDPSHRRLCQSYDGHYWFLACDLFLQGTHYRKDLLDAMGLESPAALDKKGQWDLDTLQAYARALHAPQSEFSGISLRGGQGGQLAALNLMVSAVGGNLFDEKGKCLLSEPEAVSALEKYTALASSLSLAQATASTDGYRQFAWHFYEGRAGMMIHNDDGVKSIKPIYLGPEKYGNCGLPTGRDKAHQALMGFGVGVRAGTEKSELAAQYVQYFVENYSISPEELDSPPLNGPICGPMHPWEEVDPLREPFHILMKEDRFFELPFARGGFTEFWNGPAENDISLMFEGRTKAADVASAWAKAFSISN